MQKVGRNELCPCGSGDKYKRCCHDKDEQGGDRTTLVVVALLAVIALAALAIFLGVGRGDGAASAGERVWDPEHGHYHDVG